MGFNYGYEKKKFDSRWKRLEVEYCDAGMSEEQIAAMKEYDWAWFCSQRVFQNHTQPIPCEQYDEVCGQSQLFRKFASLSYIGLKIPSAPCRNGRLCQARIFCEGILRPATGKAFPLNTAKDIKCGLLSFHGSASLDKS